MFLVIRLQVALDLALGRIGAQRAHHRDDIAHADSILFLLVIQAKTLAKLVNLFLRQVTGHAL